VIPLPANAQQHKMAETAVDPAPPAAAAAPATAPPAEAKRHAKKKRPSASEWRAYVLPEEIEKRRKQAEENGGQKKALMNPPLDRTIPRAVVRKMSLRAGASSMSASVVEPVRAELYRQLYSLVKHAADVVRSDRRVTIGVKDIQYAFDIDRGRTTVYTDKPPAPVSRSSKPNGKPKAESDSKMEVDDNNNDDESEDKEDADYKPEDDADDEEKENGGKKKKKTAKRSQSKK
jgi:histone H3/H4